MLAGTSSTLLHSDLLPFPVHQLQFLRRYETLGACGQACEEGWVHFISTLLLRRLVDSTLKCNGERSLGIEEDLIGCQKSQRFSRAVVTFIHGIFDFSVGDSSQVPVFREVLTDETIGILVQSALPGGIRMREVDLCFKVPGHTFLVGEFAAIVIGDGLNPILVWEEAIRNGVTDRGSRLTVDRPDNGIPGLALDQGYQCATMGFADHGVAFPVTDTPPGIDNGPTLIDRTRRGMTPRRS